MVVAWRAGVFSRDRVFSLKPPASVSGRQLKPVTQSDLQGDPDRSACKLREARGGYPVRKILIVRMRLCIAPLVEGESVMPNLDSNQKIAAGLAAGDHVPANPFAPPTIESDLLSRTEIIELGQRANSFGTKLADIVAGLYAKITTDSEKIADQWNGETTISNPAERRKIAAKKIKENIASLTEISSEERAKLIADLEAADAALGAQEKHYATCVAYLMRDQLGNPDQAFKYITVLSSAGAEGLRNAVVSAASMAKSGDAKGKALAFAILHRIDSMSDADRKRVNINRESIAQAVMGEQHAEVKNVLAHARLGIRKAIDNHRELIEGRRVDKITTNLLMQWKADSTGPDPYDLGA